MTFLNAALLSGVALLGIPIIIHLLHRRRVKIVRWGAMHLLEATLKKHQRRFRWEQLILLLIRCAIPAILALALARPVLTGLRGLFGGANASTVVLLDNSYSMEAGGRPSNFELARQFTTAKLKSLSGGSDVAVHLMAGGQLNVPSPSTDAARFTEAVAQLDSGFGKASMPDSLNRSAELLGAMKNSFREIIVVSDFQRINWPPAEAATRSRALETLRKQPIPPQITFVRPGREARENISVDALEFSRLIAGVGQPVQLRASLRNHGERAWPDLRVLFKVDGRERSVQQITLQPGEQKQLLFTHTFETGGSHVAEVTTDADSLKADNSSLAAIPVWDKVPVLLVNGDPSTVPLRGETDFLEIALKPFGLAKIPFADLIEPRIMDAGALTADALSRARVCVLANVRQLTDRQVQNLRDFVREGGGLLIFPGNKADPDWYNKSLHGGGLLPAPIVALGGSPAANAPAAKIVAEHYAHPALDLFNDPRNGTLGDTEVKFWFKFGPPTNPNDAIPPLARLDAGDPFLLERKFGEGRVIVCATTADADWSNLPARPAFVPLMQRLVTYLASTVFPPRNVTVGKPLIAFFPRNDARKKAFITEPSGRRSELTVEMVGTHGVIEHRNTAQPGLYTLTGPDGAAVHFVVAAPREESDLAWLSDEELKVFAKEAAAEIVTSFEEYSALDHKRRFGREYWRPLLWTVLALAVAELVLEQWFARRARQ